MWRAVDKLRELGPHLPFPHASAVRGNEGAGLRELRPRAGRSPWRAIYASATGRWWWPRVAQRRNTTPEVSGEQSMRRRHDCQSVTPSKENPS
jgi:hypothetical protein